MAKTAVKPKNPVISQEVADTVVTTFVSASPSLPVDMMGPNEVSKAKLEEQEKPEGNKKRLLSLVRRDAHLLEREFTGGWFNFGQIVKQEVIPTPRGLQIQLTNYRKDTIKCNVNRNNLYLMSDLEKAKIIASNENKALYLMTSAYGDWDNNKWFDSLYVSFKDVK
jgi:hypothetical protein